MISYCIIAVEKSARMVVADIMHFGMLDSMAQYMTGVEVEREYPFLLRRTLEHWRLLNKGPRYIKIGRKVVYARSAIEEFISAGEVETGPVEVRTKRVNRKRVTV